MIPSFNVSGVLPPFVGENPTNPASMSPYETSMTAMVRRFATTVERIDILRGLIGYRDALRTLGIREGFQWIDGSFVEQVEDTRGRPPADIDLVTFAHRPGVTAEQWRALVQDHRDLFSLSSVKQQYKCDAYFVDVDKDPLLVVNDTRYWFGLFSHQRATALWKGMLLIPLQSDDDAACQLLEQ